MIYDTVIVGGGIAGLYTAYTLLKQNPSLSLLIVEKNNELGGRASSTIFQGVSVVTGAGVGRLNKDILLIELMKELRLPVKKFNASHYYAPSTPRINAKRVFQLLKEAYTEKPVRATFKEFALSVINTSTYNAFCTVAGYTDYENEDANDTLFHYGFEDNLDEWTGFYVPWKKIMTKLADYIGYDRILTSTNVTQLRRTHRGGFRISFGDGFHTFSKRVVLATTIDAVRRLVPVQLKRYKQIKGQPFLRLYAKCTPESARFLSQHVKGMTIVGGPLQKILPINPKEGIYMISYSDNTNASNLSYFTTNTANHRRMFSILIEHALQLPSRSIELTHIMGIYWKIGTHYYTPNPVKETRLEFIHKVQRPLQNLFVVGEMVSLNQGWVEGALQSVQEVIGEISDN
jgi:hypothetical protein